MENFVSTPVTIRSHALFDLVQHTNRTIEIVSKSPRVKAAKADAILIADVDANPQHFATAVIPALKAAGAVAFVIANIDGKVAQLAITADDWAKGAAERNRFEAWNEATIAEVKSRREFFDGMNEGGEGYNPYRV